MDYFLDFILVSILIIASTAFLGSISAKIVGLFARKKATQSYERTLDTKRGWKKVGGNVK